MNNKVDYNLDQGSRDSILQTIQSLKSMMPFLIKLADADRVSMQMIDDGRKPFVEKCIDFGSRSPELDPGPGFLPAAMNDLTLFGGLATIENQLLQLLEMVHDTRQAAGSEAYEVARYIYMKAKMNVKIGIPGSQAIVDELGKLYKQAGAPSKPTDAK